MKNVITVETRNEKLVVSSRLVANRLDIGHDLLLKTITKYESTIQARFGVLGFENRKPPESTKGGRPTKTYYLTENQAIFITTLSRNTEAVVNLKADLVQAFSDARKPKALSLADQLLLSAQLLVNHEDRIKILEAKTTTRVEEYSIAGYARLKGVHVNRAIAGTMGRKATALCRSRDIEYTDTHDPRWGKVNVYPVEIVKEVFDQHYASKA